jgi:antitoxin component YwqK of YwqJK toxin-antitoxin module
VIHIVTSKNSPDWHIELNEAWVLGGGVSTPANTLASVRSYEETYPTGETKATWSAGLAGGRYLLQGRQIFYYEDGHKQWESNYEAGNRTGVETWWSDTGVKLSQRTYAADGVWDWKLFDAAGHVTAESRWKGKDLLDANPAGSLSR